MTYKAESWKIINYGNVYGYGHLIGAAIETAAKTQANNYSDEVIAGKTGIVYERTVTLPHESTDPRSTGVVLGEFFVPGDATKPAQYDRLSARYVRAFGGRSHGTSFWLPYWFDRQHRETIIELDPNETLSSTEGLNRIHGMMSEIVQAEVTYESTYTAQLSSPSMLRMGELLIDQNVLTLPHIEQASTAAS